MSELRTVLLLVVQILTAAIFAQVVISWLLMFGIRNPLVLTLYRAVTTINEPLMRPLRRIVPRIGMIDLTPMAAIFVLIIIREGVKAL